MFILAGVVAITFVVLFWPSKETVMSDEDQRLAVYLGRACLDNRPVKLARHLRDRNAM